MDVGSSIKSFIERVRNEVEEGIGDWELKSTIELELSTVVEGDAQAGLDIKVIKVGANVKAEETQKIKLSIGQKSEVEEEERKARIAEAKTKELEQIAKGSQLARQSTVVRQIVESRVDKR